MHCFINLPKGPLRPSIPNPNNLPRDGRRSTSYSSPSWVQCAIFAAFGFFSCSQYFSLVYVYTLLITADKQCVVYIWLKKITEENLPRYYPPAQQEVSQVLSLFQKFWILPQVYFRFSWLLKRLKRSRIGAWPGLGVSAWTRAVDSMDGGWYFTGWHKNTHILSQSQQYHFTAAFFINVWPVF